MKLVEMKCPNCNGQLKVNTEKDFIVCGYCHTEFKIDDGTIRTETHHTYTDEAKIKEIDAKTELEKIKIEKEKREGKTKLIICLVGLVLGLLPIYGPIIAFLIWTANK